MPSISPSRTQTVTLQVRTFPLTGVPQVCHIGGEHHHLGSERCDRRRCDYPPGFARDLPDRRNLQRLDGDGALVGAAATGAIAMTRRMAAAAMLWITLAGSAQAQMRAPKEPDREISHVRGISIWCATAANTRSFW